VSDLAERAAQALAGVEGVLAVVLGGSRASGLGDPTSDVDLGIYYDAERPPALGGLRAVGAALQGGRAPEIAGFGDWGPWMNGGSWLEVEGTKVDWIFRERGRVDSVFDDCVAGRVSCDYYLGHPHGYHNHYYLAEVHHCVPLFDPHGVVAAWKQRITPYPATLGQALIERYLYDAGFMLDLGQKSVPRADVLHATGCLFRCAAALVQVVFALNAEFTMNEKRSLRATDSFETRPRHFADRVAAVLSCPGHDESDLSRSYALLRTVLDETRQLAPPLAYAWPPAG
jgi:hypothetical protein